MNFTPGPWKAHSYNTTDYIDIDAGCERICSIYLGTPEDTTDTSDYEILERKANAQLIAAAPRMYQLLKEIYEDDKNGGECNHIPHGIKMDIREVLSTIKGEKL